MLPAKDNVARALRTPGKVLSLATNCLRGTIDFCLPRYTPTFPYEGQPKDGGFKLNLHACQYEKRDVSASTTLDLEASAIQDHKDSVAMQERKDLAVSEAALALS